MFKGDSEFIAVAEDCKDGAALVEMRNRFKRGDILEVLSPGTAFNKSFTVDKMTNLSGEDVEDAKTVQEKLLINIPFEIEKGDILRRKN